MDIAKYRAAQNIHKRYGGRTRRRTRESIRINHLVRANSPNDCAPREVMPGLSLRENGRLAHN